MSIGRLMALGAAIGLITVVFSAVFSQPMISVVAFGGGMLFGKGYGIWEERDRLQERKL